MKAEKKMKKQRKSLIETIGRKIPDPTIIFMLLFAITMVLTYFLGGKEFTTLAKDGSTITYHIKNMFEAENMRWIFDNALLKNWLHTGMAY